MIWGMISKYICVYIYIYISFLFLPSSKFHKVIRIRLYFYSYIFFDSQLKLLLSIATSCHFYASVRVTKGAYKFRCQSEGTLTSVFKSWWVNTHLSTKGGHSIELWSFLSVMLFLCPSKTCCLGLPRFLTPSPQLREHAEFFLGMSFYGVTGKFLQPIVCGNQRASSFVSHILGITVLHFLMSNILSVLYIFVLSMQESKSGTGCLSNG